MNVRVAWLLLLILLLPSGYFAWTERDLPHLGLHHDDELYLVSADDLTRNGQFRVASLPAQPAQTKYPVLYPLMLALVWNPNQSLAQNAPALMGITYVTAVAFLLVAFATIRSFGFASWRALLVAVLLVAPPMFSLLATSLMSEMLFTAMLLGALLLAERAQQEGVTWRVALLAGLLGGLAYLVRSAAVPILLTSPILLLLHRQRRQALAFFAGMLPCVVGWQAWVKLNQSHARDMVSRYYTDYMGFRQDHITTADLPRLVWLNLDHFLNSFGRLLSFIEEPSIIEAQLIRFLGVAGIVGALRLTWRARRWHYPIACAVMSVMVIGWHYTPNERLVFPLFLMVAMGAVAEAEHVWTLIRRTMQAPSRTDRIFARCFAAVVLVAVPLLFWRNVEAHYSWLPGVYRAQREWRKERDSAIAWVAQNTPATATVWSYDDGLLYLAARRRGATLPMVPELAYRNTDREVARVVEGFPGFAIETGLTHVLITRSDFHRDLQSDNRQKIAARLLRGPEYTRVYQCEEFEVFVRSNHSALPLN